MHKLMLKCRRTSFCYLKVLMFLAIGGALSPYTTAGTYEFDAVDGINTPSLTTTVDGVTLTATQSAGNNITVTSGFLDHATVFNGDFWTISFSSPIDTAGSFYPRCQWSE